MVVQGYSWYMVDKSPLDFKGTIVFRQKRSIDIGVGWFIPQ